MTVIAYDGHIICADGRSTSGHELLSDNAVKLVIGRNERHAPCIYAMTGTEAAFEILRGWFASGHDPKLVPATGDDGWTLIVLDATGLRAVNQLRWHHHDNQCGASVGL
jgi:hypothetical protein